MILLRFELSWLELTMRILVQVAWARQAFRRESLDYSIKRGRKWVARGQTSVAVMFVFAVEAESPIAQVSLT